MLHQIANINDVVVLQAVGGSHRKLQLVDLLEKVRIELGFNCLFLAVRFVRLLKIDEELHLILNDARGQCGDVFRRYRTVRLDGHGKLIIICYLTHTGILYLVGNFLYRAVERIDRNKSDRRILRAVLHCCNIAFTRLNSEFHVQVRRLIKGADHKAWIHYFDVMPRFDHAGGHRSGLGGFKGKPLRSLAMHSKRERFDIKHDIRQILSYTRNG